MIRTGDSIRESNTKALPIRRGFLNWNKTCFSMDFGTNNRLLIDQIARQ